MLWRQLHALFDVLEAIRGSAQFYRGSSSPLLPRLDPNFEQKEHTR